MLLACIWRGVILKKPRKNAHKKKADLLQFEQKCVTLRTTANPGTICAKWGQDSVISCERKTLDPSPV